VIAFLLILAGPPADTIRLGPGVHPGPLVLARPTVVLGERGAVLRGSGRGSVLVINAPGCVVRGLRIEGSGRNPDGPDAAVLVRADSATIEDLTIRDMLFGVYLLESDGTVLRRLDIAGPGGRREGEMGDGIYLYHSRGVRAQGNTIDGVRDGIYFSYSDSALMTDNRVSHVRFGLHYMFSHYNRFAGNVFTDNAAGAVLMNSNGVVVTDNAFAWNSGSRSYGLVLQTATEPVVRGNSFVGNGVGVFFDNVVRGDFEHNVIAGNWLGLELFANSEQTRVTGNTITGNTFDAAGGYSGGAFQLCVLGRGNYWAAATAAGDGYDLDGDGVLDIPHAASSPLAELALTRGSLRLFLGSPAARALDWAERTFPVFDVAQVTDSCPLAAAPHSLGLSRLPAAPSAARRGGRTAQLAVALSALTLGLVSFSIPARRRRVRVA
jgi:nitrous oxidase accessory protein